MKKFEHEDYLDARLCFRGDEEKVIAVLDAYAQKQIDFADINRVFELYHTKIFLKKLLIFPNGQKKNIMNIKAEH